MPDSDWRASMPTRRPSFWSRLGAPCPMKTNHKVPPGWTRAAAFFAAASMSSAAAAWSKIVATKGTLRVRSSHLAHASPLARAPVTSGTMR